MKLLMQRTQRTGALLPLILMIVTTCSNTPLNNIFDTQPIYNALGTDKFYAKREHCEGRWYISPFYQHTGTVRNGCGKKTHAGDRLGQWNMFGLFFGSDAIPHGKTMANYPAILAARTGAHDVTNRPQLATPSRYRGGVDLGQEIDLTLENNFNPLNDTFAYISRPAKYEKVGVRTQFNFDTKCGLGVSARAGVVDVKFKVKRIILEQQFQSDINATSATLGFRSSPKIEQKANPASRDSRTVIDDQQDTNLPLILRSSTEAQQDAKDLYAALFADNKLSAISKDLDLNFTSTYAYRSTNAEDIHLQAYWHIPIELNDDDGDLAVVVVPYVAFGAWFPTGKKADLTDPFVVPTGNDGFYILTFEGSIAFDFPLIPENQQNLQLCVGGGATTALDTHTRTARLPSTGRSDSGIEPSSATDFQTGFYPWSTTIRHRPGTTWYFNASLKAGKFLGGLSFYGDYIYTQHLKDHVRIQEPYADRKASFESCLGRYKRDTTWKNQQFNVGFDYQVARALSLGGAIQWHLSGERVFNPTTMMGSITFVF